MSEPNRMEFPDTFEEYVKIYGIEDIARIYTNGSILIPALRAQQWIEHIRPKGEWIESLDGQGRMLVCKQCGYQNRKHYSWYPNFCEDCGADMRGTESEG